MTARVLAIDAGNTRVKWALYAGLERERGGALWTAEAARVADEWHGIDPGTRAIASNVAGAEIERSLHSACAARGLSLHVIASPPEALGVKNGYRDARQLGPDRWAGLVAAHHAHPGNKLVVNAGTALTVDALARDGRFLGGLIVPGPALMRRSLDRGTAGLRLTEGTFQRFPASTADAITTGAVLACSGAIERMRAAMDANGTPVALVVLSGGAAPELSAHLSGPLAVEENLVLDGLARIALA
jgi:type III pantothenate kinase